MEQTINPETLFRELSVQTTAEKEVILKRHEFLKTAGSTDTNIYWIETGSLKIYILDDAEERIVRFAYPGNIIASLDSFIRETPSDFYIQALRKTRLKVIPKHTFIALINSDISYLKIWNQLLEDLVVQQLEREKDLLTSSPGERFRRVLKRSPRLFQEIPEKHIANYLRMSPETLSRLKNLDFYQDLKEKNG